MYLWLRSSLVSAFASLLLGAASGDEPVLVAHRGASHDAPENTLPAFLLAWKQGADAIEGDFHLTKDGRIVCIHDDGTGRVSGVEKVVAESDLADLKKLDAGEWFGPAWKGTRIPLFGEVAATVPKGKLFYIEIKCGPEIVGTLLEEIEKADLKKEQLVVISFDEAVIKEVENRAPELKTCWLSSFKKGGVLSPSLNDVLRKLEAMKTDGFSSKADPRIEEDFVQRILDEKYEYHCWTVDDEKTARRFLDLGAISLTTNRPAWLRARLGG